MSIDIISAGAAGSHTLRRVNVNLDEDYIYFRDSTESGEGFSEFIPSGIISGTSFIYSSGLGSVSGVSEGELIYAFVRNNQELFLSSTIPTSSGETTIDLTDFSAGTVNFNTPVIADNILNTNSSTVPNQAVKYFTTGDPIVGLTNQQVYFLRNVSADFAGQLPLYTLNGNTHTFTSCGRTGRVGPNQSEILSGYSTDWSAQYLTIGDFNGYQDWTVPVSGVYQFDVYGASGYEGDGPGNAGRGARVQGRVELTKGEIITIAVGQRGEAPTSSNLWGGSGGGTFIVRKTGSDPLFVAGGGSASANSSNGLDAVLTTAGGFSQTGQEGGFDGNGGQARGGFSAGGGGFFSIGVDTNNSVPGGSFSSGLTAVLRTGNTGTFGDSVGGAGGFGGGANADGNRAGQSGGGGGYSGGAGARTTIGPRSGGGGGSFIMLAATNVGTSNGTYETLTSFNGGAITNLSSYRIGDGQVILTLVESFTTGNTVHPTAVDAANNTNLIAIESAGNSYHSLVPINFDILNNAIHSPAPHTLTNGEAVILNFAGTPPTGLSNGTIYYVNFINAYSYKISSQPTPNLNVLNLIGPSSASSGDTLRRVVVNTDTDTLTINNHGFLVDQPIQYSAGDGTPIQPLQEGSTYYVAQVIDANRIRLKNALNAPTFIEFTSAGTGTNHSFIFLTVNIAEDTLYIPNHGLVSGQAVRYNNGGGVSIGGLVNNQLYFVIRVDASLIRLATNTALTNIVNITGVGTGTQSLVITSIDFTTDTITLPNHGYLQGELIQYDSRGQTEITGLTTNTPYYVIFINGDNIKLATSPENAENGVAVDILESPAGVGRHTFTSLSQTPDGIYNISSTPSANTFTVTARGNVPVITKIFNPRSSVDLNLNAFKVPSHGFLTGTKVTYDQGLAATDIGGLVDGTNYFTVTINRDYFRLATTAENAASGITFDITGFGTGIGHEFVADQINGNVTGAGSVSVASGSVLVNGVGTSFSKILKVGDRFRLFPPNVETQITFAAADINTTTNRITKAHTFETGDTVVFSAGGGVSPTPLINDYYYFIRDISDTEVTLHTSESDAIANINSVDITTQGTGTDFNLTKTTPVSPIIRRITAVGSDIQITVDRPYASAYSGVSYSFPTFIYVRPEGYSLHRPFDGGVEMSVGAGTSLGQIVRQTRKYFRYQSGKGLQTSAGINFKPSIDIESMERFSENQITCVTRRPHGLVSGLFVRISQATDSQDVDSSIYNGDFQVTVVNLTTFRISAAVTVPEGNEARAYGFPQFHVREWSGGAIRSGMMDFQNGMFFEFDGQKLYCVRRSSTQQMAGTVSALQGSEVVFGTGTKFSAQVDVGDFIVLRGQSYRVVEIASDTRMSIRPEYKGSSGTEKEFDPGNGTTGVVRLSTEIFQIIGHGFSEKLPVVYNSIDGEPIGGLINGRTYYIDFIDNNNFKLLASPDSETNVNLSTVGTTNVHSFTPAKSGIISTLTVDVKVPQEDWSIDPCDGAGPTGYNLDISKIQMVYIDYSWYGAGKIRFGFKTTNGEVQYIHEFVHNNILFESYLRSGNLPGRYEVVTFDNPTYIPFLFHWGTSVIMDGRFDDDRAYLFTASSQTLDISGTTPKSFSSSGINLTTDLFTVQSHGFRIRDVVQFQSIAANGLPGDNLQNPATEVVGSNAFATLRNNARYGVFVNSPNLIHLTPEDVTFSFGSEQSITSAQDGTTVTITTTNPHDLTTGMYVGIYGSSRVSNGPYTVTRISDTQFTYVVSAEPGIQVNVTNRSLTSNVATITTSGPHGYIQGSIIVVAGVNNAVFNGTYTVTSTPTTNTLTYARVNANIASGSSTGTVSISIPTLEDTGIIIAEVINFTTQGNTQFTYFLFPDGSLGNTSGPNYQPLLSLRLSPSVSSGLTGRLGDRDIINRMQLRLREVGVSSTELVDVKLLLNPRLNNLNFIGVDSPSLVQIIEHTAQDTVSGGVQVYNFKASGGSGGEATTDVDVEELFELSNSILGGDSIFPDGPDIITIAVSRLTGSDTLTSAKMSWTEAQA